MSLAGGTNYAKLLGLLVAAVFVLWFLYQGMKLVGRFGSYEQPTSVSGNRGREALQP